MGRFADWFFGPAEVRSETPPLSDPNNIRSAPMRQPLSDRAVYTRDALGLSAVYRAITVMTTAAKQISLKAYRNGDEIDTPLILKQPDINMTRSRFVERTVVSMALAGNAFWLVKRTGDRNVLTNLTVLDPHTVEPHADNNGIHDGWQYGGRTYSLDEIAHLALMPIPGQVKGLGPIQAAQVELRGSLDTRDFAHNWFYSGGVPTGILKSDQDISPDVADRARATWNEQNSAGNGISVLGNGLDFTPLALSPEDAQWIQAQQFNITSVARLFGIPARMMLAAVEGSGETYANLQDEYINYIRFGLMTYLVEIEDTLSSLLPGLQEVHFNVEALLRADTSSRYASYKTALDAGFMSAQEVRDIEHLGPMPADLKKKNAAPPVAPPAAQPQEALNG